MFHRTLKNAHIRRLALRSEGNIINEHLDLMVQTELGRFHEFSVGARVGARLMLERLKEL